MRISKKPFLVTLSLLIVVGFFSCKNGDGFIAPNELTISEGFTNPIGFYDNNPTFSWKLPNGAQSQSSYSIVVASSPDLLPNKADLWQSGQVKSDQTLYVKYEGNAFASRQKAYWQVKFWDEKGKASDWSEVSNFELGLLNNSDWQAKWISLPKVGKEKSPKTNKKSYKVQYLRKDFTIGGYSGSC